MKTLTPLTSKVERSASAGAGRWPHYLLRFWWDMLPARAAPANQGIESPDFVPPEWLSDDKEYDATALDHARRAHDQAIARAATAEEKAARLVNLSLTLLGLSLALAAFELGFVRQEGGGLCWLYMLPVGLAAVCLSIGGIEALEIDRVGLYYQPGGGEWCSNTKHVAVLLRIEERGRFLASWTASKKYSELLQARAWFSRGLVAVIIAALVAVFTASPPLSKGAATADSTPAAAVLP